MIAAYYNEIDPLAAAWRRKGPTAGADGSASPAGAACWLEDYSSDRRSQRGEHNGKHDGRKPAAAGETCGMELSGGQRRERGQAPTPGHDVDGTASRRAESEHGTGLTGAYRISGDGTGPTDGFWRTADWLFCRDGKWRPVESGTFPLAHGTAARVGRLRGYGNAIVAPQAEAFIRAAMDILGVHGDAIKENAPA